MIYYRIESYIADILQVGSKYYIKMIYYRIESGSKRGSGEKRRKDLKRGSRSLRKQSLLSERSSKEWERI